ncbi:hypothetical protein ACFRAR_26450 [Kitasatospora sp. NPDC056651]
MRLGVNVPNFGPGTGPGVLRARARTARRAWQDLTTAADRRKEAAA